MFAREVVFPENRNGEIEESLCYLLSDQLVELQWLYEMYCANENIRDSKKMKYFLHKNFKESICITPVYWIHENPVAVYAHQVDPVYYAIASIIGAGLLEEEIAISFAKMTHRKIKAQEIGTNFPFSAENLSAVI